MPFESSTFGCVAQSLHAMQCVRFVRSGEIDGNLAKKSAFWLE